MFLLITFLVIITSICYLSQVAESPTKYEDFTAPLIIMFFYALMCIIMAWKNLIEKDENEYWGRGYYDDFDGTRYRTGYRNSAPAASSKRTYDDTNYSQYMPPKPLETVTKFVSDEPKERNITEKIVIKTYPDKKKVKEEIKRLERNPFWRIKRGFYKIFGVDITDELYKPKEHVKYVTKKGTEIKTSSLYKDSSYNLVLSKVGRSFDVTVGADENKILTENTLTYGGEQQATGDTESSASIINF